MTPSSISIKLDGVDITSQCLFQECTFESQANPIQGTFKVSVKDEDQTFAPVAGQKITCHIDGIPLFGGYVMRIGRGHFFPAQDTTVPASVARKWNLSGPDFNMLFDKRVLYDPNDPTAALDIPLGKRTISGAYTYTVQNFIDVPSGLDLWTYRDTIRTAYGDDEKGAMLVGQGKTWRDQMEDLMDHGAVMYYIDADFAVHLHEYEALVSPWLFTDSAPNGTTSIGFREGEYEEDYSQLVTEALVWGGSAIREETGGTGGDIVFAKYPQAPANDVTLWAGTESEVVLPAGREQNAIDRRNLYGKWQTGEERAGENNYLTLDSVRSRAFSIINGPPGSVPTYGIESGYSKPLERMRCAWFAHDVPGGEHIRPGYITSFILRTQGSGGGTKITTLPLRSLRISFPTLPSDSPGDTYVRFDGDFGVSFSDRRYLWKALRKAKKGLKSTGALVIVDNSTSNIPPHSYGTYWPIQTPNGSRTDFTFQNSAGTQVGFLVGEFDVYMNGLYQRGAIDYLYDPDTQIVSFTVAPGVGDQIYVTGYVST